MAGEIRHGSHVQASGEAQYSDRAGRRRAIFAAI
jgi:hypothetical protein